MLVGTAGDLNYDNVVDLLITVRDSTGSDTPFVVFGRHGIDRENFNLSDINGTNGFKIVGLTSVGAGAMDSPGDISGDGFADLAIGDPTSGHAYFVFSRVMQDFDSVFNISDIDGYNGFIVTGPAAAQLGWTVGSAGDINDDGFDDIFIGSFYSESFAWVVFGHAAPWTPIILNVASLDGTNGFYFSDTASAFWGQSGGDAGDVNGDGIDDLIIGGYSAYNFAGTVKTGAAIVLFGQQQGVMWPSYFKRDEIFGSVGLFIDGISDDSQFGTAARGAGDVNDDGIADIIIGAKRHSLSQGFAALIFGINDHCAICSNITSDVCLACRNDFVWSSTECIFNGTLTASSSSSFPRIESNSPTTLVLETDGNGGTVSEVIAEIATLLGVDATAITVVEVTPGTFEITVNSDSLAQQLVNAINQCISQR